MKGMGGAMVWSPRAECRGGHAACGEGRFKQSAAPLPIAANRGKGCQDHRHGLALIKVTPDGLVLKERAPGVTVDEIKKATRRNSSLGQTCRKCIL